MIRQSTAKRYEVRPHSLRKYFKTQLTKLGTIHSDYIEYMMEQTQRFAFVDGRMKDLTEEYSPLLMPLISDRWTKYFSWMGKGDMPEKERTQLRLHVRQAHENGQLIRFWATPDIPGKEREAVWTELLEAGVDLVNTDDLGGLRTFLLGRGDESNE